MMKDDLAPRQPTGSPPSGAFSIEGAKVLPPVSKRAARRVIQRAFVLAGRNKRVRQEIREVRLKTLWVLEDWNFSWTVMVDRGEVEFYRRPAKRPDLILAWQTAARFFAQVESGGREEDSFEREGDPAHWRAIQPVFRALRACLQEVLRDPVDEDGTPLL